MLKHISFFLFIAVGIYSVAQFSSCSCNSAVNPHEDSLTNIIQGNRELMDLTVHINDDPKNPELYYQRSKAFMSIDSLKLAYDDIEKAIDFDSTNVKYHFLLTDIYLQGSYAEGAVGELLTIIKLQPDNLIARAKLAKVYLFIKDHQSSLSQIEEILKTNDNNPDAYFLMGMNYKEMTDTARAIAAFQKCVQYNQNFYDAFMQLGLLHSAQKKNLAPSYFDNAIRLDSSKTEAWYAKAKYYQDMGDAADKKKNNPEAKTNYEEAKKTYRELIAKNPQYEFAYFNLGFIYIQQDSIDKALRHFDLATKVSPQYAEAYYYRGLCELEKGQKDQAESDFQQTLNLKPDYKAAQDELDKLNKK
ncbi:MAG: tetratricopeptide repeat protein [Bacteroidota bacterium]